MNAKILATIGVVGLAAAATTYGTFAFFSDTETSTDNIFTAGDLDLTLDGLNGVTATIVGTNFAPGDDTSGSIMLRNEGSIFTGDAQGHLVDLDWSVVSTVVDDTGNLDDAEDGGVSAVPFDTFLVLTTFSYDGQDLLPQIGDLDGDGRANTLNDLEAYGVFRDLADPGAAGKPLAIDVHFDEVGPNHLKRDATNLAFTFYLTQSAADDLVGTTHFYANTFAAPLGSEWSATTRTTSPSGAQTFLGELTAEDVTLSVAGIPAHTSLRVQFDVYILRSWDGNSVSSTGPDLWRFLLDGATLVNTSFSNVGSQQCYPADCPASNPTKTGAFSVNTLGYAGFGDGIYRITLDVPHTASAASLVFRGLPNQNLADEAWGLDNVRVSYA